jgi:hypothetical protein
MAAQYKTKVSGPANLHTKKEYNGVQEQPVDVTNPPRFAKNGNKPGEYSGQMKTLGGEQKFAKPLNMGAPAEIRGLHSLHNDIGESSGFITDGYLDKQGTPYGEAAKFNFLPPGMDISNQENAEINEMPLRKLVAESYPGDGWMPAPQDIPE